MAKDIQIRLKEHNSNKAKCNPYFFIVNFSFIFSTVMDNIFKILRVIEFIPEGKKISSKLWKALKGVFFLNNQITFKGNEKLKKH
jgi:hypothetical protein